MKKFAAILFLILIAAPFVVLAQASSNPCSIGALPTSGDKAQALPKCVNQIYIWSLGISSLLALLMLIVGGYYYMTSAGNAENATKGVEMIWSAVIGLALLFGAYLLLNTINPDLVRLPTSSINQLNSPTNNVRQ